MRLNYFEDEDFDPKTMDLFYIYIPKYKMFEKQGFVIPPDYCLLKEKYSKNRFELHVSKRKNFINLVTNAEDFIIKNNIVHKKPEKKKEDNNFGLKFRVIVGKNGEGKTSLLKLLSGNSNPEILRQLSQLNTDINNLHTSDKLNCIYIFKDSAGKFAASDKCNIIIDEKLHTVDNKIINSRKKTDDIINLCMNNQPIIPFEKGFFNSYLENKSLYDGILGTKKLFTKFKIDLWNIENFEKVINTYLPIKESIPPISQSIDILEYYFLVNLTNQNFHEILFNLRNYDLNGQNLKRLLNDSLYDDQSIRETFKKIIEGNKDISEFNTIKKELKKLEKMLQKRIKLVIENNELLDSVKNKEIEFETTLDDLIYFRGFDDNNYRFLEDFSDGEQNQLRYRYELNEYLKQDNPVWWYIDEPERSLHPEWARRFIDDYINAYNSVIKYLYKKGNKRVLQRNHTVLFTTHSPFILTDLTNDYIIFLSKEKRSHESAFLGNIGQLLVNNMFLSNTMGEHSKQLINQLIQTLNDSEKNESIDKTKVKLIFNEIGDEVLKNILLEQLEGYEWKK